MNRRQHSGHHIFRILPSENSTVLTNGEGIQRPRMFTNFLEAVKFLRKNPNLKYAIVRLPSSAIPKNINNQQKAEANVKFLLTSIPMTEVQIATDGFFIRTDNSDINARATFIEPVAKVEDFLDKASFEKLRELGLDPSEVFLRTEDISADGFTKGFGAITPSQYWSLVVKTLQMQAEVESLSLVNSLLNAIPDSTDTAIEKFKKSNDSDRIAQFSALHKLTNRFQEDSTRAIHDNARLAREHAELLRTFTKLVSEIHAGTDLGDSGVISEIRALESVKTGLSTNFMFNPNVLVETLQAQESKIALLTVDNELLRNMNQSLNGRLQGFDRGLTAEQVAKLRDEKDKLQSMNDSLRGSNATCRETIKTLRFELDVTKNLLTRTREYNNDLLVDYATLKATYLREYERAVHKKPPPLPNTKADHTRPPLSTETRPTPPVLRGQVVPVTTETRSFVPGVNLTRSEVVSSKNVTRTDAKSSDRKQQQSPREKSGSKSLLSQLGLSDLGVNYRNKS